MRPAVPIRPGMILLWFLVFGRGQEAAGEGSPACTDPLFLQYEARIRDRPSLDEQRKAWREFLQMNPGNPCRQLVEERIGDLERSASLGQEKEREEDWKQKSRGGLLETGREVLPSTQVFPDPVPRNRLRLASDLLLQGDTGSFRTGVLDPVWNGILRLESAPVHNLTLSLDLPLVGGRPQGGTFGFALGNIVLGVRGNMGWRLFGERASLWASGGAWWGTGSSTWSAKGRKKTLDAAAYASPAFYSFFRDHVSDYALHLEALLGVGTHFVGLGISYHVLTQEERLEFKTRPDAAFQIARLDLSYQWRVADFLAPFCEFSLAVANPASSEASYFLLAPGVQFLFGDWTASLAARLPFWDAAAFGLLTISIEVGTRL